MHTPFCCCTVSIPGDLQHPQQGREEQGRKEMSMARLPRCACQPPGLPLPPGRRCYSSQLRSGWRHSALLLPGGCQPLGVLFAALREVPEVGWGEGAVGEGVISMQGGVLVSFNVNQQKTCFLGLFVRSLKLSKRWGLGEIKSKCLPLRSSAAALLCAWLACRGLLCSLLLSLLLLLPRIQVVPSRAS